ncbi:MAG: AMP-binding protein, partial [Solirubrobacteraceae bacterium]
MALSYSQGTGTTPLLGETIGANFDRAVATFPERDALIVRHQGLRLTYGELGENVDWTARALHALGLRKGDRLGIWAPNCGEWVHVQFATAKLGIILVNINPAFRTTELAYALRQSGCRALIAAPEFKGSDYRAIVDEVRDDLPELEHVFFLGDEVHALVRSAPAEIEWPELDFDEPINIQYTSGTTGAPKGATLSHHNILNNGYFVGEFCRYTEEDRVCIPVPFYHCFGMVMGNLGC